MSSATTGTTWAYPCAEGSREMRDLLGGKGANVAEMTRILGPERVPAGFTITTEACVAYMRAKAEARGRSARRRGGPRRPGRRALERLEAVAGKRLGDALDPLLVSVRSDARESVPGMLDTVLDLGSSATAVNGLAARTDNERFPGDAYRRLVQMFANVVRGLPGERIEDAVKRAKSARGARDDTELHAEVLRELMDAMKGPYSEHTGEDFPQDPTDQLHQAVRAVFGLVDGRARRRLPAPGPHPRPVGDGGERVQQMVFGNRRAATATCRTRSSRLRRGASSCSRRATRSVRRRPRFAVDAVKEGMLDEHGALATIDADALDALLHQIFDPSFEYEVLVSGSTPRRARPRARSSSPRRRRWPPASGSANPYRVPVHGWRPPRPRAQPRSRGSSSAGWTLGHALRHEMGVASCRWSRARGDSSASAGSMAGMPLPRPPRLRLVLALAWAGLATLTDVPGWCLGHLGPLAFLIGPATILAVLVILGMAALTGRLRDVRVWRGPPAGGAPDRDVTWPPLGPGPDP